MSERPNAGSRHFDARRTGWTIEDCVESVKRMDDDPENQFYYVTYSNVFHTTPRCPYIQDSESLHVAGLRSSLNGPYMAGENRVAGPTDEFCDLQECGWCAENGGDHLHER